MRAAQPILDGGDSEQIDDGRGPDGKAEPKTPGDHGRRRRRKKPKRPRAAQKRSGQPRQGSGSKDNEKKSESTRQTLQLLDIALEQEFFHTADGRTFADVRDRGHRESWPLDSIEFKSWLREQFRIRHQWVVHNNVLQNVVTELQAKAIRKDPPEDAAVRVAWHNGKVYLDLADTERHVVEIDRDGWRLAQSPPVRFYRPKGLEALPKPRQGGSLNSLRRFLNVDDSGFRLIAAFLLSPFMPDGTRPILILVGEAGSAKTTALRVIRGLVDPNVSAARVLPKKEKDMFIAAQNSAILAYDNVSKLTDAQSDALCRIATKSGLGERTYYTNMGETLAEVQAPIILNGIESFATRGDLLSRSILIELKPVQEKKRKAETVLRREFVRATPRLLGALLDGVVHALRGFETTHLDRTPRMADFAKWGAAGVPGFGWKPEDFLNPYWENVRSGDRIALEADPLSSALLRFMSERRGEWRGSAEQLLRGLRALVGNRFRELPPVPNALSNRLRRLSPNLRRVGLNALIGKNRHGRFIELWRDDVDDGTD